MRTYNYHTDSDEQIEKQAAAFRVGRLLRGARADLALAERYLASVAVRAAEAPTEHAEAFAQAVEESARARAVVAMWEARLRVAVAAM